MTRTEQNFFSLFQEWSEEEDLWDLLKKSDLPIYIYGMGNGADRLAERLHSLGIAEKGYFASNAFVRGQSFRGFPVETFYAILERESRVIALLAFGTRLPEVIADFRAIASATPLYVPDLPLVGEEYFDRAFLKSHASELASACASLSDSSSRDLFCALVKYRLTGDMETLLGAVDSSVPPFLLGSEETVVDLGAYNGDSIAAFRAVFPQIKSYIAVEPDERTYRKLQKYAENSAAEGVTIRTVQGAAGNGEGSVRFFSSANRNSSRTNPSHVKKTVDVPLVAVDRVAVSAGVGLIKFDVEGMELEALEGCLETVARCRPVLKISVYHRSEDLHRLLLFCKEHYPRAQYRLRRFPCVPAWETDLYVIPEERSRSDA